MADGGLEKMVKNTYNKWKIGVAYTDTHGKYLDEGSKAILLTYIEDNKKDITHIIDLGDGVDNPFMSDFPVNADFNMSAQAEFDLYAQFVNEIHSVVPKAEYTIVAGNHDKGRLDKAKRMNRGIASLRNLNYEAVLKDALNKAGVNLKQIKLVDGSKEIKITKDNNILVTHGDPRLDTNIKGGVTGARRTAEMYPVSGDIYMGHTHISKLFPRNYVNKHLYNLPMMANIEDMKKVYLSHHPYENGFMVFKYNKAKNILLHEPIQIKKGKALIDGTIYEYK